MEREHDEAIRIFILQDWFPTKLPPAVTHPASHDEN